MPAKGKRARKYTFEEIVIAVGIATGAPKKEIGSSLGGITARAVHYKIAGTASLTELADAIVPLLPQRQEVREINPKHLEKELSKLTSHAYAAVENSLRDSKNPKDAATLGLSVIKQIREQESGDGAADHPLYTMSEQVLDAFSSDVLMDRALIARARGLEAPADAAN